MRPSIIHAMNTRMSDILSPTVRNGCLPKPGLVCNTLLVYLERSSLRFSHVGGAGLSFLAKLKQQKCATITEMKGEK